MGLLKNMLIGVLVFSGVMVGLVNWQADIFAANHVTIANNMSTLNFVQEINNQTKEMANTFQQTTISTGTFAIPLLVAQGIYEIVKLLFTVIGSVFTNLVYGIAGFLPGFIPTWFTALVVSIITISVLLALVAAVLKWVL